MTCIISQWGQILYLRGNFEFSEVHEILCETGILTEKNIFLTVSVKFRSKNQMSSLKIPMRLQKDFDVTEHYVFKNEFRTI